MHINKNQWLTILVVTETSHIATNKKTITNCSNVIIIYYI